MKSTQPPKVSVLVPIYNSEQYLVRSLEYFAKQTLQDVEFVFVNDGSSDNSIACLYALVEQWQMQDRVNIISHDKNRGVAGARNTALQNATGEFIFFVDADDWIDTDCLKEMYQKAIDENADIVGCDQVLHFSDHTEYVALPLAGSALVNLKKVLTNEMVGGLSHLLIRKALFDTHKIFFIEGANYGEDLQAKIPLLIHCHKFAYIGKSYYHYDQTNCFSVSHMPLKCHYYGRYQNIVSMIDSLSSYIEKEQLAQQIIDLKMAARAHLLKSGKFNDPKAILPYSEVNNLRLILKNKVLGKKNLLILLLEKFHCRYFLKFIIKNKL